MIKPWPWVALVIVLASLFGLHLYDKRSAVNAAIVTTTATMNKEYQEKLDKAISEAAEVSGALLAQSYIAEETKDAKIKTLTNSLNTALNSLSNRPKRQPSTVPANPASVASSCTGAELYAEDGGFLAGEAARADQALIDRDFYYNQYENARTKLESFKSK